MSFSTMNGMSVSTEHLNAMINAFVLFLSLNLIYDHVHTSLFEFEFSGVFLFQKTFLFRTHSFYADGIALVCTF